ncbi:MAG: 50S ribosomal protein L6 [Chlamydiales bacterium]|nr:50S ribosomal protein L6 [Chlamydiia bacterium]MCP5506889.1 50S ribosomal protein L6 [Chlamydiales bacterium]
MSRKGKLPIPMPKGVEVSVKGTEVSAKGPKGSLSVSVRKDVDITIENGILTVAMTSNKKDTKAFHGLYRSLISNMVHGVSEGFTKTLDMIGVGYRASVKGNNVDLNVGLSHPMLLPIPEGIEVKVEKNTKIIITGADKQKVGQFAADIRSVRPPEPYKGKGIRYTDEYVRRKAGKSAAKG